MPTGYTADIGKGISFQEYALGCARAFGALVTMRDEPSDAPIPEKFEPTDYHLKAIREAKARLAELTGISIEQRDELAAQAYREAVARWRERESEREALRVRYEAMLKQARAYVPPTPDHVNYKDFMISQIEESIKWDCSHAYDQPEQIDGERWLKQQFEQCKRDLDYHAKEHAAEVTRTDSRNAWINALRQSLSSIPAQGTAL